MPELSKLVSREKLWCAQQFLENMPNLKLKSSQPLEWQEYRWNNKVTGNLFVFLNQNSDNCYFSRRKMLQNQVFLELFGERMCPFYSSFYILFIMDGGYGEATN
jgi:hypothetical protein